MRNPMYNKIPRQQVINSQKSEPDLSDYDEYIDEWLATKEQRRQNVTKQSKTRYKKRNNRYAKEERIYGE